MIFKDFLNFQLPRKVNKIVEIVKIDKYLKKEKLLLSKKVFPNFQIKVLKPKKTTQKRILQILYTMQIFVFF